MKKLLLPIIPFAIMLLIPIIVVSTIAETVEGIFDFTLEDNSRVNFRLSDRIKEVIYEDKEVLNETLLVVCAYQASDNLPALNDCFSNSYLSQNQDFLKEDTLYEELEQIIINQGYNLFNGSLPHHEYLTSDLHYPIQSSSVVTSQYGFRVSPITGDFEFHNALDIAANKHTPVQSFTSGKIIKIDNDATRGNYMIVESNNLFDYPEPDCEESEEEGVVCIYEVHPDDQHVLIVRTWYLHLNSFTAMGFVDSGQVLAEVGETGAATGPHVHFAIEISVDGSPFQFVNPHLLLIP